MASSIQPRPPAIKDLRSAEVMSRGQAIPGQERGEENSEAGAPFVDAGGGAAEGFSTAPIVT